jgi:CxxC motif-containing protein (DUF1111 family)
MRTLPLLVLLSVALSFNHAVPGGPAEAPAAFDGASNGLVDQATHDADRKAFDDVETVADGLGPIYNAQSCRECHQNPASGGASQISELRVGHRDHSGRFVNPSVPIANGAAVITGRTLINDRAICPSGGFPDLELQERVPDTETIRTRRMSLGLFGDGFVEAVADDMLKAIAERQCRETRGRICGLANSVPVLEAPGKQAVGRFGWKAQQASLLSFSADAYLNEMGITSRLLPEEFTTLCDTTKDPEDVVKDGLGDIDRFARFMRATKAPPRDRKLALTEDATRGSALFDSIGCATCHVRSLETAPAGTAVNGGAFVVPPALGGKVFYPFSDFLLHDVGTGDGIALAPVEHFGKAYADMQRTYDPTANRLRTPPLWGVRTHSRLMHDGASETFTDAILRHRGEASRERKKFMRLKETEKQQLLAFLRSL